MNWPAAVIAIAVMAALGVSMLVGDRQREREHQDVRAAAARYASVIAACANGQSLDIAGRVIHCKVVADK